MSSQPPVSAVTSGSILIYGKLGTGKTSVAHHAFWGSSFTLLSEADGLSTCEAHFGFVPEEGKNFYLLRDVGDRPYEEVLAAIQAYVVPQIEAGLVTCVILDTLSTFARRLLYSLQDKYSDARSLYPAVGKCVEQLLGMLLSYGVWVVALGHEQGPRVDRGWKGGLKVPGSLVEEVPKLFSLVLRSEIRDVNGECVYLLCCNPIHPTFTMKDRWGVAHREQIADLRPMIYQRMFPGSQVPAFDPMPIRKAADHAGVFKG